MSESLSTSISTLLNKHSKENDSNTPDFILAKYLIECLTSFNKAVCARENWYGRSNVIPSTKEKT